MADMEPIMAIAEKHGLVAWLLSPFIIKQIIWRAAGLVKPSAFSIFPYFNIRFILLYAS